jgi:hypothetical protein
MLSSEGVIFLQPNEIPQPNEMPPPNDEIQNYENVLQSSAWQNIKFDENKMGRVVKKIGNNEENLPQIIEAAIVVLELLNGIKVIMIPLCLLARKTNPLLFSGYRNTKRNSSGL